jgi:hypothetical protein
MCLFGKEVSGDMGVKRLSIPAVRVMVDEQ